MADKWFLVEDALRKNGLLLQERLQDQDWLGIAIRKDRDVHRFMSIRTAQGRPGSNSRRRIQALTKGLRLGSGIRPCYRWEWSRIRGETPGSGSESPASGGEIIAIKAVNREPPIVVTLVQGIVRGDRMDFIIQKAAEIGVRRIVPLAAEHGVVRVTGEKARRRVERWRKIAREACKQCGRVVVPEVTEVVDLGQALQMQGDALGIFFYEGEKTVL